MKQCWAALVVLTLAAFIPVTAAAQSGTPSPSGERMSGELGQNFPNPFNPETKIPFAVGDPPTCSDRSRLYRVSLKVYNVLAQLVAIPVLQGGTSGNAGRPIDNLMLTCEEYTAYWDGKYINSSREVASGIYLYRLEIDGMARVKKMIVMK